MLQSSIVSHKTAPQAPVDTPPQVFVVDDDISVRESLEALIRSAGWHAHTFGRAREFLDGPSGAGAGCLVLDVGLPDMSGLDVQRLVKESRGCLPIIFITGSADIPTAVEALKGGADEFLTKPIDADQLLAAIERATERSRQQLRVGAEVAELRRRHTSLTPREVQVMALVIAGRLNKQVAGELDISEITVKAHRGKVMRKMKARSLPDLVRMAAKLGISA